MCCDSLNNDIGVQVYLFQSVSKLENAQPSAVPTAQSIPKRASHVGHDMAQVMDTVVEQLAKVCCHQFVSLSQVLRTLWPSTLLLRLQHTAEPAADHRNCVTGACWRLSAIPRLGWERVPRMAVDHGQ